MEKKIGHSSVFSYRPIVITRDCLKWQMVSLIANMKTSFALYDF